MKRRATAARDKEQAEQDLDYLNGLTFEGEEVSEPSNEITFHLLEALVHGKAGDFARWRQAAVEKLPATTSQSGARIPLEMRLAGFDAVALRLGMVASGVGLKNVV